MTTTPTAATPEPSTPCLPSGAIAGVRPNAPTPVRKGPGFLARAVAFLLAILFIIFLPIALLAFDARQVVFNPTRVKQAVAEEAVNHDLIPAGLAWFSERRARERVEQAEALGGDEEPDIGLLMSFLDDRDWKAIKDEVLTPEILTGWVSETVDQTYAWIDSADAVPQITWTAQDFKKRVNSEHGRKAILIAYARLPPCTQGEVNDFLDRLDTAGDRPVLYNLCQFPDPWKEDQLQDYADAVNEVAGKIPDKFPLTRELQAAKAVDPEPDPEAAEAVKQPLRLLRLAGQWAWAAPVLLLVLITALAVRSFKSLTRWWGVPLLAGGLIALLPSLAYGPLIASGLATLTESPGLFRDEAARAVTRLASAVFQPLLLQAGIVVLVGILLVALSRLGRKKEAKG